MNKRLEQILADVDASRGEVGTYEAVSFAFEELERKIGEADNVQEALAELLFAVDDHGTGDVCYQVQNLLNERSALQVRLDKALTHSRAVRRGGT